MTRSKTIDMTKVPGDPWDRREYLLSELLPVVLERSKEYIHNRYRSRQQLKASLEFAMHDLSDVPSGVYDVLKRMWFFPWTESQHELSVALNHALLGFHRASYDHQRRALELILVGSFFVSEITTESEAKKWVSSVGRTPMFTKTLKRLAKVGMYARLESKTDWLGEVQKFYWCLSDISHVRGDQNGFRSIQPSNFHTDGIPGCSVEALEKTLDSFVATISYIAMLVALSNPALLFGLPIEEKFGINGPISGFFEEGQTERLRALIPERHRDILVALAEEDPGVVNIRDYFCSLPNLSVDQIQKQIEGFRNQMNELAPKGENPDEAITIPLGPSRDGHS